MIRFGGVSDETIGFCAVDIDNESVGTSLFAVVHIDLKRKYCEANRCGECGVNLTGDAGLETSTTAIELFHNSLNTHTD